MAFGRRTKAAAGPGATVEKTNHNVGPNGAAPGNRAAAVGGSIRSDIESAFIEFVGTFVFLLFALGGIQAAWNNTNAGAPQYGHGLIRPTWDIFQIWYAAASMGFSLLFASWLFYRVPGPIFNPNVATALLLTGYIGPVRWILYCIAEILGAIAAAATVLALVPGPLASNTFPGVGVNKTQAVFLEMFMTATLCLAVLMLSFERRGLGAANVAPIGLGITLFAVQLFGFSYTGGAVNTARSFGPAVVSGFYRQHWIYWLGPVLGSFLAAGFYHIVRRTRLWNADVNGDGVDNWHGVGGNADNLNAGGRYGAAGAPNNFAGGPGANNNLPGAGTNNTTGGYAAGRSSNLTGTTADAPGYGHAHGHHTAGVGNEVV